VAKDSASGLPLSFYGNWSDMKKNHNKFYIVQVLQHKSIATSFALYIRYGRVGVVGVANAASQANLESAQKAFHK